MKKIIIVGAIFVIGFTGVAYAKDFIGSSWTLDTTFEPFREGQIKIYKVVDDKASCYTAVSIGPNGSQNVSISCVK